MYKKCIELENLCNSKCIILFILILIYTHESILTYCECLDLFQTNTKMLDRPLKEYFIFCIITFQHFWLEVVNIRSMIPLIIFKTFFFIILSLKQFLHECT